MDRKGVNFKNMTTKKLLGVWTDFKLARHKDYFNLSQEHEHFLTVFQREEFIEILLERILKNEKVIDILLDKLGWDNEHLKNLYRKIHDG